MLLLPTRILNMELKRLSEGQPTVLEPTTSFDNVTFDVNINERMVKYCLCDTGARASVLPKAIADQIGIQAYEETNELMTMIDGTMTRPLGKVTNVEVKIDHYTVPTNFLIVEMESSFDVPIIMGRPFIASTGAVVNLVDRSAMFTNLGNLIVTRRLLPPPHAIQVDSSPSPS